MNKFGLSIHIAHCGAFFFCDYQSDTDVVLRDLYIFKTIEGCMLQQ